MTRYLAAHVIEWLLIWLLLLWRVSLVEGQSVTLVQGGEFLTAHLNSEQREIAALGVKIFYAGDSGIVHDSQGHTACAETAEAQKESWAHTGTGFTRVILLDLQEVDAIADGPVFTCALRDPLFPQSCSADASDASGYPVPIRCDVVPDAAAAARPTPTPSDRVEDHGGAAILSGGAAAGVPAATTGSGCQLDANPNAPIAWWLLGCGLGVYVLTRQPRG